MPKNDNAHSIRMVESLMKHVGDTYATDFESLEKIADVMMENLLRINY